MSGITSEWEAEAAPREAAARSPGLDYGITDLNKLGVHGFTQSLHPRLQWVY
jgi:hypothetical protein